ncbi:hypothetical protein FE697_003650 [Mumia zhuanghuii]|uniref:Uncharacterized protein n=2 Tax=Mumia TaxID=1546255 RepID=A0ABW1QL43_9ACTN|nr:MULTISPECIES: hypothetical protein [Mumia]KAA1425000.1 hypothetical protein FE697_003650 [Mumia zhuanghuii]
MSPLKPDGIPDANDDRARRAEWHHVRHDQGHDFTQLPEQVLLDRAVISADERPVYAPEGDRVQPLWAALEAGG